MCTLAICALSTTGLGQRVGTKIEVNPSSYRVYVSQSVVISGKITDENGRAIPANQRKMITLTEGGKALESKQPNTDGRFKFQLKGRPKGEYYFQFLYRTEATDKFKSSRSQTFSVAFEQVPTALEFAKTDIELFFLNGSDTKERPQAPLTGVLKSLVPGFVVPASSSVTFARQATGTVSESFLTDANGKLIANAFVENAPFPVVYVFNFLGDPAQIFAASSASVKITVTQAEGEARVRAVDSKRRAAEAYGWLTFYREDPLATFGVAGEKITVTVHGPNRTKISVTTTTDANGRFSAPFTYSQPGNHFCTLSWIDRNGYFHSKLNNRNQVFP